nr:MAG TPA: hypothetical protein [Bacteriophage sp.]
MFPTKVERRRSWNDHLVWGSIPQLLPISYDKGI